MSTHQSPALDILRALAAIEVLLVHVRSAAFVEFGALPEAQRTVVMAAFYFVTRLGQEAVMVFFVLSGFLVGGQMIRRVSEGTFNVAHFGIDRATRILMPLIPSVLIASAIQTWMSTPPAATQILGNLIGLNSLLVPTLDFLPPLWSLTYEIWFYILAGAVGVVASRRSLIAAAVIFCCLLVFSKISALYLCFWCLGALAASFQHLPFRKAAIAALMAGPVALFGVISFQLSFASKSFANVEVISSQAALSLICIGIAMSIPFLTSRRVSTVLAPVGRLSSAVAAFSYTLYLIHYPVQMALDPWLGRASSVSSESILFFAVRIGVALVVAIAMYWLFERNTGAMRRLLVYRWSGKPTAQFNS